MAVEITSGTINRNDVVVTLNITMKLRDWNLLQRELSAQQPVSLLVKDKLGPVLKRIV